MDLEEARKKLKSVQTRVSDFDASKALDIGIILFLMDLILLAEKNSLEAFKTMVAGNLTFLPVLIVSEHGELVRLPCKIHFPKYVMIKRATVILSCICSCYAGNGCSLRARLPTVPQGSSARAKFGRCGRVAGDCFSSRGQFDDIHLESLRKSLDENMKLWPGSGMLRDCRCDLTHFKALL